MSNIGSQLTEAFAGLDRTQELMSLQEENDPKERTLNLDNLKGEVIFKDLSFGYDNKTEVLHNISFLAKQGSVTA